MRITKIHFELSSVKVNSLNRPIHSTQIGISNFWKWFGKSKVVDEGGRPLVVFHGSGVKFEEHLTDTIGRTWFTSDLDYAEQYAYSGKNIGNIMACYLKIDNPFDFGFRSSLTEVKFEDMSDRVINRLMEDFKQGKLSKSNAMKLVDELREREDNYGSKFLKVYEWVNSDSIFDRIIKSIGYDGYLSREDLKADKATFAVFSSNQIKSAIGNNGNFGKNSNITASIKFIL